MQVILLERVRKLGQMGDEVSVKDGFARNFLLPSGKALRATDANRKVFESQKTQLEARNLEQQAEAQQVADKLNGTAYVLVRQAGESGQLYGSVSTRDIADAVDAMGVTLERRQIQLDKPIKEIGLHPLEILLHGDVSAQITVNVARSEEEAERQARGENVLLTDDEREALEAQEAAEQAEALFEEGAAPELNDAGEDDAANAPEQAEQADPGDSDGGEETKSTAE